MTTHEQQTLHDESQSQVTETDPSLSPEAEVSTPPSAPSRDVGQEQNLSQERDLSQSAPVPEEPSTVSEGTSAQGEATTVSAQPAEANRETSLEETLFGDHELAELRGRWAGVQAAFVDDPKECVQKADVLVSDLVEQLTSGFAQARSRLEEQWAQGQEASTEDLRVALMHYREFFERLLAV
ncbi:MAG: hypothetical protein JO236_03335 [Mycobacterium sp.]|uniref:hypothetical protein n=1 Tax=Mycobacterium sp. TaxID=1785 RepID=UPI001ED262FF|nr:hypothetical protein [Mycobacterium sp.]MBW0016567.1 hypothetical protein [Mycobacterium sp.]